MRLKLTLHTKGRNALLPFNYQYPLSAAIYKIIQSADRDFASFLHDTGYGSSHKNFKLFTFSDINTPFLKSGDRMQLQTNAAEVTICFYVPQAAEHFIRGLFLKQELEVADAKSKTTFQVVQAECLPETFSSASEYVLQPLSPLVAGRKNAKGHYDYRSPTDEDFTGCLLHNWLEKYMAVHSAGEEALRQLSQPVTIRVQLLPQPPQQRLLTIKAGTAAQTKIRGYTRFRLKTSAPEAMMKLALGAGLGLYNAQGFGCIRVV
jgi:CRISPR-associated endoribonuclease Cas6